jgi:hypothetical protein
VLNPSFKQSQKTELFVHYNISSLFRPFISDVQQAADEIPEIENGVTHAPAAAAVTSIDDSVQMAEPAEPLQAEPAEERRESDGKPQVADSSSTLVDTRMVMQTASAKSWKRFITKWLDAACFALELHTDSNKVKLQILRIRKVRSIFADYSFLVTIFPGHAEFGKWLYSW